MSTIGSPAKSYTDFRNVNVKGGSLGLGLIRWAPAPSGSNGTWSSNPFSSTDYGLYLNSSDQLVFSSLGSTTIIGAAGASGSVPSWEQIFAADATFSKTTTFTIDNTSLNNDVLTLTNTGAGSGDVLQITNVGTGKDVNGTSSTWSVTKAGAAVFTDIDSPLITSTAALTIAVDGANVLTLGSGSNTITAAVATTFSSTVTVTDGLVTLISTSNIAPSTLITNNTVTTYGAAAASAGVVVIRSTSLTTGSLLRLQLTEGNLTTGNYLDCYDVTGSAFVYEIGEDGIVTQAGVGGSTVHTITAGDFVMSDGSLAITDADNAATFSVTNSTATTASVVALVGAGAFTGTTTAGWMTMTTVGLTTGTMFYMKADGLTTGEMLWIDHATAVIADGGSMLRISSTSIDTGGTTNGTLLDISSTAQIAGVTIKVATALTTGTAMLISSSAALTTTGNLLTLTANSATTGAGILRINGDALTSGIGAVIASSATAITGAGRLLRVDHTGATTSTGTIVEFATSATDAANATTLLKLTAGASIVGVNLSVVSTTGLTTGSLIRATTSTAGALATNGAISFSATGDFTSTSVINGGFVEIKANSTAAGTIVNVIGTSLTTGVGLVLSNGTSAITTGSLLRVTAGGTGAIATNGIVSITHAGIYTSTTAIDGGLLDIRAAATTAGVLVNVVAAGLITGVGVHISNATAATTSGSLLRVTAGGTGAVATNGIVSFVHTGIYTSTTVGFVNVSASATTGGTVMTVTGAGITDGTGLQLSNAGLTTGKHFNILQAAGASVFSISTLGATVIAGNASGTNALTLTAGDIAVSSGAVKVVGRISSSSAAAAGGIGYATGAGGTATQITNRSTGVTMSPNPCMSGTITTDTTSLAAGASAEFTVTNSAVAIGDIVLVTQRSGSSTVAGVAGTTVVEVVTVAAGSFIISINNNSSTTAETGAIIINFAIIKAVSA